MSISCLSAESESVVNLFSKHQMLSLLFDFPFVFCCNFLPSSHHSGVLLCGMVSDCECNDPVHFGIQGTVMFFFMHFNAGRAYTDVSFGEMLMSMFCN